MGEDRSVRARVDGRNLILCLIAHVIMDEEGIELRNLLERTACAGRESMIFQRAAMTVGEDVARLV
jgi:hypothetical protein